MNLKVSRSQPIDRLKGVLPRTALLGVLHRRLAGLRRDWGDVSISFGAGGSIQVGEGDPIELLKEEEVISPFEADLLRDEKLRQDRQAPPCITVTFC